MCECKGWQEGQVKGGLDEPRLWVVQQGDVLGADICSLLYTMAQTLNVTCAHGEYFHSLQGDKLFIAVPRLE